MTDKSINEIEATDIIWDIIEKRGDKEFGYMAQALLGIIFYCLGYKIIEIKNKGHPDLLLRFDNRIYRIEVEVIGINRTEHVIKIEDLDAIKPKEDGDRGYIALLDTGFPLRWHLLPYEKICKEGQKSYSRGEIKIKSDENLSNKCTDQLYIIVLTNKDKILNTDYSQIIGKINNNKIYRGNQCRIE